MNMSTIHGSRQVIVAAAIVAASASGGASRVDSAVAQEFAGSMPCGPEVRAFAG